MGFFKRSGNSRGVFQDTSIEPERSLFSNDDEACLPCSVADGDATIINGTNCETPDPYVSEVTLDDFDQQP